MASDSNVFNPIFFPLCIVTIVICVWLTRHLINQPLAVDHGIGIIAIIGATIAGATFPGITVFVMCMYIGIVGGLGWYAYDVILVEHKDELRNGLNSGLVILVVVVFGVFTVKRILTPFEPAETNSRVDSQLSDSTPSPSTDSKSSGIASEPAKKSEGFIHFDLAHEDATKVSWKCSKNDYKDFVTTADFYNPYSTTVNAWSYGFVFRSNDDDGVSSYRVTAKSNQKAGFVRWWNVNKSESFTEVRASVISTTESGWNSLELRVEADIASLSINGTNIGHFPQSTTDDPGKVCAGTGFLGSDMTLGKVTPVKNWRIESLDN